MAGWFGQSEAGTFIATTPSAKTYSKVMAASYTASFSFVNLNLSLLVGQSYNLSDPSII